jgi:hypothetical protein
VTDAGIFLCKKGSFVYIQNMKEDNDFISGITISDSMIMLSHSWHNYVSVFQWSANFIYEFTAKIKMMGALKNEQSAINLLKHDKYAKSLAQVYCVVT